MKKNEEKTDSNKLHKEKPIPCICWVFNPDGTVQETLVEDYSRLLEYNYKAETSNEKYLASK
jgi:Pyruvate/2-oxoacid:ferredoxin oxidoreductase delta subunit